MAVFKCKMCGADLYVSENMKIAVCEYCGSTQTLPAIDNEKKLNLFNRATRLRRNSEFDKAASIYENIIAEFPEEAEGYWGLCLSNYGIEYVDDPVTGVKKPTCHRASLGKLEKDENFLLAMEYADVSSRKVYRDEAREIDRIMDGILAVSRNEKPYDVFICYKEKDENGARTPDSVLAQDIYDALVSKGLKVFFARITLEEKLGTAYEPYIFAALNSANVMLVIGTKYEYFNAVWVRNEWSRFLKLMTKDRKKVIIPCFKDMDAYDIPEEFAHLQAQDMSKLGFIQDLTHGVLKITGNAEKKQTAVVNNDDSDRISVIFERAKMFLEDGNFRKANDVFEQALNIDHKNAKAYLGKLLADTESKNLEQLKDCLTDFSDNDNYLMILRFGDAELVEKVKECLEKTKENIRARHNAAVYDEAIKNLKKGDLVSVQSAAEAFNSIIDWKDSKEKSELCRKKIEEIHNKKIQAIRLKKRKKFIAISSVISFVIFCIFLFVLFKNILPNMKYNRAVEYMEAGYYVEAADMFSELNRLKKSDEYFIDCKIAIAEEYMSKSEYEEAINILKNCNSADSKLQNKLTDCYSALFDLYINEGKYSDARSVLRYFDYPLLEKKELELEKAISEGNYNTALSLISSGDIEGAYELLSDIADNKEAFEKAGELRLQLNRNNIRNCNVGDRIIFGAYDIDGEEENGKEEITWRVLDKIDGRVLVISEQVLFFTRYGDYQNTTWATSLLRTKLNNEFFNDAFSESEKALIPAVMVVAEQNGNRNKGADTNDKVFALSMSEAKNYFSGEYDRICSPTAHAERYCSVQLDGTVSWWLRTVGLSGPDYNTFINDDGIIYNGGTQLTRYDVGVRPAMWIEIY